MDIRLVVKGDIISLKLILDSIELFPSEMLDDMISDYFDNPYSEDIWFTALEDDIPISIGYCVPEKLTEGTYNLLALGIRNDIIGKGVGGKMLCFIEAHLSTKGHRMLIIETSSTETFSSSRAFYQRHEYKQEAVIRDFWSDGDDKVVFKKRLN